MEKQFIVYVLLFAFETHVYHVKYLQLINMKLIMTNEVHDICHPCNFCI